MCFVFFDYENTANMAAPKIRDTKTEITIPINIHNNTALAKFALFGLAPEPNAQTKSIIRLTSGIANISMVTTQSTVFTTPELLWFSIV